MDRRNLRSLCPKTSWLMPFLKKNFSFLDSLLAFDRLNEIVLCHIVKVVKVDTHACLYV